MADDGKQEPAPASPMLDDAEDSAAGGFNGWDQLPN